MCWSLNFFRRSRGKTSKQPLSSEWLQGRLIFFWGGSNFCGVKKIEITKRREKSSKKISLLLIKMIGTCTCEGGNPKIYVGAICDTCIEGKKPNFTLRGTCAKKTSHHTAHVHKKSGSDYGSWKKYKCPNKKFAGYPIFQLIKKNGLFFGTKWGGGKTKTHQTFGTFFFCLFLCLVMCFHMLSRVFISCFVACCFHVSSWSDESEYYGNARVDDLKFKTLSSLAKKRNFTVELTQIPK